MFYKPSSAISLIFMTVALALNHACYSQGWEWRNPLPQGNNTFCTWFTDANTGFLVGDFGTLLRTKDGGNTWEQHNLGTSAHLRTINFADDMTGYAGGNSGMLFKTVNGGNDWFQLQISNSEDVFKSIWFISPDTGFVVSYYGNLFRTTNGGNSWTTIDIGGSCIRFYDSQNGIISGYGFIHRTDDGGITWTTVYLDEPVYDCAYASENIVLAGGYPMRRSVDGGMTWDTVTGAPEGIWTFYFTDELTGYAAGVEGKIYKTTDAGLTWILQSQNYTESLFSIFFIGETGYVTGGGTFRPALYKTTNGGTNWQNLASGKGITYFTDLDIADENTIYCVGYHRILRSTDQGDNWQVVDSTSGFHFAVDFPTALTGYVGGSGTIPSHQSILKTVDGGVTWQTFSIPDAVNAIDFTSETHGIAAGQSSIFRTTDGGNTWTTPYYCYVTSFGDVEFVDSLTGYVVGGTWYDDVSYGNILKTTDGGINWVNTIVTNGLGGVSFPTKDTGYAAGGSTLMKTVNGGDDWTEIELIDIYGINSVFFLNADTGFLACNWGKVLKTIDGGLSWAWQWSKTGQDINVVKFINENTGFIAGDGCVLLKTSDSGGLPVAVKDIPLTNAKLNVYPNPVIDEITIESEPNSTLTVYNLTGRLIFSQKTEGVFTKLNFRSFPCGMYIIRQQNESTVSTSKVIKN